MQMPDVLCWYYWLMSVKLKEKEWRTGSKTMKLNYLWLFALSYNSSLSRHTYYTHVQLYSFTRERICLLPPGVQ